MAIIGIVAVDRAGAIGRGGTLPWHYSADLKFFKEQTTGNACVMGYKTWLSLKKPLPNRLNIVLTRRAEVPLTVEDADTFLPPGLLEGFSSHDSRDLGDDLNVTFYERAR